VLIHYSAFSRSVEVKVNARWFSGAMLLIDKLCVALKFSFKHGCLRAVRSTEHMS
jgi:hypothetical protein